MYFEGHDGFIKATSVAVAGLVLTACGEGGRPLDHAPRAGGGTCLVAPADNGTGYAPPPNTASLPTEVPRPGPDILYWPLATSPQLENTGIWTAEPIMVSGASVYRNGEFLYQDYLYDDKGAAPATPVPDPIFLAFGSKLTGWGGYTYPTDPAYAGNAADFVEVRVRPTAAATAMRISYNSMINPDLAATTIALGDSDAPMEMPHGANARMPAKLFVTVHGCNADVVDAATGQVLNIKPQVAVDLERRQVEVHIPYAAFDPRGQKAVRIGAATGLWDTANGKYLVPQDSADSDTPGGSGGRENPAAFFNVAFRFTEEVVFESTDTVSPLGANNAWMEYRQATALASGDLSEFFANVDFAKLAAGVNDEQLDQPGGVPQTGFLVRIHVSHFEPTQGRGSDGGSTVPCEPPDCIPLYSGRLQPYSIYVPAKRSPAGYGMVISPHGAGASYNSTGFRTQFAERGPGSVSINMTGRNPASWWLGLGIAEVFEVWADVAAHYPLDPNYTVVQGGSMGGWASYKLAGQFPDLFAASAPWIPCPSAGTNWIPGMSAPGGDERVVRPLFPNFRNVPLFVIAGELDPICAYWRNLEDAQVLDALGYRYKFWSIPDSHGLPFFINFGSFAPVVEWMGENRIDRNPPHVTYVFYKPFHEPQYGINADHAYWVSGLKLRTEEGLAPLGKIDVRSHGFGVGDAPALETHYGAGMMERGDPLPVLPYRSQEKYWGPAPAEPVKNKLDIAAENISEMTINVDRARVGCDAALNVQTDGPLKVSLTGANCNRQEMH